MYKKCITLLIKRPLAEASKLRHSEFLAKAAFAALTAI